MQEAQPTILDIRMAFPKVDKGAVLTDNEIQAKTQAVLAEWASESTELEATKPVTTTEDLQLPAELDLTANYKIIERYQKSIQQYFGEQRMSEVIAALPSKIDLLALSRWGFNLLNYCIGIDEACADHVLSLLPDTLSPEEVSALGHFIKADSSSLQNTERFLAKIDSIDLGGFRQMDDYAWSSALKDTSIAATFLEKLSAPINIAQLSESSSQTVIQLAVQDRKIAQRTRNSSILYEKLPELFDFSRPTRAAWDFVISIYGVSIREISSRMIFPSSLNAPNEGCKQVISNCLPYRPEQAPKLLNQYLALTDLTTIESAGAELLLNVLREAEYSQKNTDDENVADTVVASIPNTLPISELSLGGVLVLNSILSHRGFSKKAELLEKLQGPLDLTKIPHNIDTILRKTTSEFTESMLATIQPTSILDLSDGATKLLEGFCISRPEIIPTILTIPTDLKNLNQFQASLLAECIKEAKIENTMQVFDSLSKSLSKAPITGPEFMICWKLLDDPSFKDKVAEILSHLRSEVRKPLDLDTISTNTQVGPYLHEQIALLPIVKETRKEFAFGWQRFELKKEDSIAYIYIKKGAFPPKIQFRTDLHVREKRYQFGQSNEKLASYKEACQAIPEFINMGFYQELNDNPKAILENPRILEKPITGLSEDTSFREVFGGAQVNQYLDYKEQSLIDHLTSQYYYINLELKAHGIVHGHPHDRNMNVRFLLVDSEGKKQVLFDANQAIRLAKEQKCQLTPIVTLRDWDRSKSS